MTQLLIFRAAYSRVKAIFSQRYHSFCLVVQFSQPNILTMRLFWRFERSLVFFSFVVRLSGSSLKQTLSLRYYFDIIDIVWCNYIYLILCLVTTRIIYKKRLPYIFEVFNQKWDFQRNLFCETKKWRVGHIVCVQLSVIYFFPLKNQQFSTSSISDDFLTK